MAWERMAAALMLCCLWLDSAFSNPLQIYQKDAFDDPAEERLSNMTTLGPHLPENNRFRGTLDEIALDTNSTQPDSSSSQSLDQSDTSESKSSPEDTSENTSEHMDSEEDNTSESKSQESVDTTSEESDETDTQSQNQSDSDENGDTRDDSQGSEEQTLKNWMKVFHLTGDTENDTAVNEDTSQTEQHVREEAQVVNISKAERSDGGTSDNTQSEERVAGQNRLMGCQQGVNYGGCDHSEFFPPPDSADDSHDSLMPNYKQEELQLR